MIPSSPSRGRQRSDVMLRVLGGFSSLEEYWIMSQGEWVVPAMPCPWLGLDLLPRAKRTLEDRLILAKRPVASYF